MFNQKTYFAVIAEKDLSTSDFEKWTSFSEADKKTKLLGVLQTKKTIDLYSADPALPKTLSAALTLAASEAEEVKTTEIAKDDVIAIPTRIKPLDPQRLKVGDITTISHCSIEFKDFQQKFEDAQQGYFASFLGKLNFFETISSAASTATSYLPGFSWLSSTKPETAPQTQPAETPKKSDSDAKTEQSSTPPAVQEPSTSPSSSEPSIPPSTSESQDKSQDLASRTSDTTSPVPASETPAIPQPSTTTSTLEIPSLIEVKAPLSKEERFLCNVLLEIISTEKSFSESVGTAAWIAETNKQMLEQQKRKLEKEGILDPALKKISIDQIIQAYKALSIPPLYIETSYLEELSEDKLTTFKTKLASKEIPLSELIEFLFYLKTSFEQGSWSKRLALLATVVAYYEKFQPIFAAIPKQKKWNNFTAQDYLIAPVQRLTRWVLFFATMTEKFQDRNSEIRDLLNYFLARTKAHCVGANEAAKPQNIQALLHRNPARPLLSPSSTPRKTNERELGWPTNSASTSDPVDELSQPQSESSSSSPPSTPRKTNEGELSSPTHSASVSDSSDQVSQPQLESSSPSSPAPSTQTLADTSMAKVNADTSEPNTSSSAATPPAATLPDSALSESMEWEKVDTITTSDGVPAPEKSHEQNKTTEVKRVDSLPVVPSTITSPISAEAQGSVFNSLATYFSSWSLTSSATPLSQPPSATSSIPPATPSNTPANIVEEKREQNSNSTSQGADGLPTSNPLPADSTSLSSQSLAAPEPQAIPASALSHPESQPTPLASTVNNAVADNNQADIANEENDATNPKKPQGRLAKAWAWMKEHPYLTANIIFWSLTSILLITLFPPAAPVIGFFTFELLAPADVVMAYAIGAVLAGIVGAVVGYVTGKIAGFVTNICCGGKAADVQTLEQQTKTTDLTDGTGLDGNSPSPADSQRVTIEPATLPTPAPEEPGQQGQGDAPAWPKQGVGGMAGLIGSAGVSSPVMSNGNNITISSSNSAQVVVPPTEAQPSASP